MVSRDVWKTWPSGLSYDKNLGLRPLLLSTDSLEPCLSHGMGDHDQILHPHSTLNLNACVCPFILDHTTAHACRNISICICICTVLQQNIISIFVCMRQFVLHMYFSCLLKIHVFVTDIYCMLPISFSLANDSAQPGNGTIWLDDVRCQGHESDLEDCDHSPWAEHDCDHNDDVGVQCY